jgi:hypothetical protein
VRRREFIAGIGIMAAWPVVNEVEISHSRHWITSPRMIEVFIAV